MSTLELFLTSIWREAVSPDVYTFLSNLWSKKLDQKQLHLQVNFVAYTSKRIDKIAFQSLYISKIIFLCRKMFSRPWEAPLELLAIFSKQLAKYPLHYWEPWAKLWCWLTFTDVCMLAGIMCISHLNEHKICYP